MALDRGAVPSVADTPSMIRAKPIANLYNIILLFQIEGAGPPNGITAIEDISPCFVPSGSSITSCHKDITPLELLIVVGVDNKAPDATMFSGDLDVFGTRLVGNALLEFSNHLLIGFG